MKQVRTYPGMPRWVKVSLIVILVVAAGLGLAVLASVGGPHGPWRHG